MPASRRWLIVTIIALAIAAGTIVSFVPSPWERRFSATLMAVVVPLGALRVGIVALIHWQAHRRTLAVLAAVGAILLLLLSFAAFEYAAEAWTNSVVPPASQK